MPVKQVELSSVKVELKLREGGAYLIVLKNISTMRLLDASVDKKKRHKLKWPVYLRWTYCCDDPLLFLEDLRTEFEKAEEDET